MARTATKTKTQKVSEETKVTSEQIENTPAEVVSKANEFIRTTDIAKLIELRTAFEDRVAELGIALTGEDIKLIDDRQQAVDEAVEAYNTYKTRYEYENYLESDSPAFEALKAGYIDMARCNIGKNFGVAVAEPKYTPVQIDFIAFDSVSKYRIFGAKLIQKAQQCGYLAALLKGVSSGKDVEDINKTFKASSKRLISEEITTEPTLAMLKKALQELVDELLFIDNTKGKNKFMVSSHWAHFFLDCITATKYGKGELSVNVYGAKRIVQAAAGMYHAFLNEYDIQLSIDDQKC